jgi:hypothetical protein
MVVHALQLGAVAMHVADDVDAAAVRQAGRGVGLDFGHAS